MIICASVLAASLLYWVLTAWLFDLSIMELARQYKNALFYPDANLFTVGQINGHNVLELVYIFIIFSVAILGVYFNYFITISNKSSKITFPQVISILSLSCLTIHSMIQQAHRMDYLKFAIKSFKNKTPDERNIAIFGKLYLFPKMTQEALAGRHQADILSDFDFSKDPYMFYHRVLSYQFYPKLSLRLDNQTPKDALLLFYKSDPMRHIPDGYTIRLKSDDDYFILAVKEQP